MALLTAGFYSAICTDDVIGARFLHFVSLDHFIGGGACSCLIAFQTRHRATNYTEPLINLMDCVSQNATEGKKGVGVLIR